MANEQTKAVSSIEDPVSAVPGVDTSSFVQQLVVDPEFSVFLGKLVEKLVLKGTSGGGVDVTVVPGNGVNRWNTAIAMGSESSGSVSWADEVNEQLSVGSDSSVGMPTGKPNGLLGGVKFGVEPGETSVAVEQSNVGVKPVEGFFHRFVRTEKALALKAALEKLVGCKLPNGAARAIAICTHTAGTMPVELFNGKRELKMLAMVGDRALSLVAAKRALRDGSDVEEAQHKFARELTDQFMSERFSGSAMRKFVAFAPGVNVQSKVGATALEACAGVVSSYASEQAVEKFYNWLVAKAISNRE